MLFNASIFTLVTWNVQGLWRCSSDRLVRRPFCSRNFHPATFNLQSFLPPQHYGGARTPLKHFVKTKAEFKNRWQRWFKRHLAVWAGGLFLLALPVVVQAQFTYTTNNNTITITGYTGPGGAVTIPSTINGLPVTSIGLGAFAGCSSLTVYYQKTQPRSNGRLSRRDF